MGSCERASSFRTAWCFVSSASVSGVRTRPVGFLLDGFPRTLDQAKALEEFAALDHVISFEIPDSLLVERLTQRRHCPKCGTVYNLATAPPKERDRCDRDGSPLAHRADDAPEAVSMRLKVYHDVTSPLIQFYRDRGLLRRHRCDRMTLRGRSAHSVGPSRSVIHPSENRGVLENVKFIGLYVALTRIPA